MSYKTILAILDTADNSGAVADFAFAIAAQNNAHVIGLHAETISAVPLVAPMEIPDPVAVQALQDMAHSETTEVERIFRQTCEVDISFLSVGDVTRQSLQVRYGLPAATDISDLIAVGAVGDLLGRYVDTQGHPVAHPLNAQVLAPDLSDYRRIPCRIIASGGSSSLDAALSSET